MENTYTHADTLNNFINIRQNKKSDMLSVKKVITNNKNKSSEKQKLNMYESNMFCKIHEAKTDRST